MPQVRPIATGKWEMNDAPPEQALELTKCQRYYNKLGAIDVDGFVWSATQFLGTVPLNTKLRTTPTLKYTANGTTIINGTTLSPTDWVINYLRGNNMRLLATGDFSSVVHYTGTVVNFNGVELDADL